MKILAACLRTAGFRCVTPLLLLCGFFFSSSVFAATLMDVYHLAQESDPVFQAADLQNLAIQERHRQAFSRLLPTITGSAEYKQTTQDIKSSDNAVFGAGKDDFDTTAYSLTLSQPVFNWEVFSGYQQSKAESLRAQAEYTIAAQDLIIRVADLYLQALAVQDQLVFARTEETAVEKHFELASGRHEMGLTPITDLHDAKARLATVQAETIEIENRLDDALQALQEMAGETIFSLNALKETIPLVNPDPDDLDRWVESALKQNPAIELQKQALEVALKEIDRQQAGHYPTLDLIGRYSNENTDGSLFGGGSEVDTTDVLLQFNLPLYQGGAVASRIRESRHQRAAARQELIRQRRAIERQTRSAYLGVQSALKRVDALQQSMVSNQLALEAKREGFLSGLYTSLAVLDAERDLNLVRQDHAQARYDYLLNSLKLRQVTGSLAKADLARISQWFR